MNKEIIRKSINKMADTKVGKFVSKVGNNPKTFLIGGSILLGAGIVYACVQSTKIETVIDNAIAEKEAVLDKAQEEDGLTEKEVRKELVKVYTKTGLTFGRMYAPCMAMITIGGLCIGHSFGLVKKELIKTKAELEGLSLFIDNYRRRVENKLGAEAEYDLAYGITEEKKDVSVVDEKGKEKKKTVTERKLPDKSNINEPGSKIFEEFKGTARSHFGSTKWVNSPVHNFVKLQGAETYAQQMLNAQNPEYGGCNFIRMNDIYELCGFAKTEWGNRNGFTYGDIIKFGFDDPRNPSSKAFMNEESPDVLLTWYGMTADGKMSTRPHDITNAGVWDD